MPEATSGLPTHLRRWFADALEIAPAGCAYLCDSKPAQRTYVCAHPQGEFDIINRDDDGRNKAKSVKDG